MARRKIPGKKHHGIRDPLKQRELRLSKIKDKINNPPGGDHQKISYKLSKFIKLKNNAKSGKPIKPIKNVGIEDKPKKPYKKIKPIKQFANESDEDYLRRVNRITHQSLKEVEYEAKYGVDVIRDPKTGEIAIKKRPKDELMELMKNKKKKSNQGVAKSTKSAQNVSKEVIKEFLSEEKAKKKEDVNLEFKRDIVKFGEVVHAPPVLSTLPRRAEKSDSVRKPGKKDSLLLKSMLNEQQLDSNTKGPLTAKKEANKSGGLKGKRKDMPLSTRLMIEDQQNKAVQLYKELKKNKLKARKE